MLRTSLITGLPGEGEAEFEELCDCLLYTSTAEGMTEKVEPLTLVKDRHPALGWPFIRGLVIFVYSMVKGMRALT